MVQFGDLRVEGPDPVQRKLASALAIVARIQFQQLADLLEGETRGLRLPDESQPAKIFRAVAPEPAFARWSLKKTLALVESDRFDAHFASGGKSSNR